MASFVGLLVGAMDKLEVAEKERLFLEENYRDGVPVGQ